MSDINIALKIDKLLRKHYALVDGSDTLDDEGHDAFLLEARDNGEKVRIVITVEEEE